MIIYSNQEVEIGSREVADIIGADMKWNYNVPCVVLREASREEYLEQCKEFEVLHLVRMEMLTNAYFYKLSID